MDVLITRCSNCEKDTIIWPPVADLSTKKPNDPIGFGCLHCGRNYQTVFSKCRLTPNELSADIMMVSSSDSQSFLTGVRLS